MLTPNKNPHRAPNHCGGLLLPNKQNQNNTANRCPSIERARSALFHLDPGCPRDEWHRIGRAAIAAGLSVDDVDTWSAPAPNYTGRRDVVAAFRTVTPDGGTGAGTLFHLAREAGWSDDTATDSTGSPRKAAKPDPKPTPAPARKIDPVAVLEACLPADYSHRYICRKLGIPAGLFTYSKSAVPLEIAGQDVRGWLAVPVRTLSGELLGLQFIPPEPKGKKLFLPGMTAAGGCFVTGGEITGDTPLAYLAEGIATAWSAHQASRAPAVCCFGWGNVGKIARELRKQYPALRLVLLPDRGKESDAAAIAAAIGNAATVEMPQDKPENFDLNDFHTERAKSDDVAALATVAALLEQAKEPPATDAPEAQQEAPTLFVRAGEMLPHLIAPDWLVRGFLEADSLALFFGDPGCGKSFLALDLACSLATGKRWHGKDTKRGAVFYLAGEGHNGMARRLKAWEIANRQPLGDAPLFVSKRAVALYDTAAALAVSDAVESMAADTGTAPRLIVVDTLSRHFVGGDENSNADMMRFITHLDSHLRERFRAAVLIVHHTGHGDKTRARGAFALKGALDTEYLMTRDPLGLVRLENSKMKDAEPPAPMAFTLEAVELPLADDQGNPVFSCAPRAADYSEPPPRTGNAGRGGNQQAALADLDQLTAEHRERLSSAGRDPEQARVTWQDWRERMIQTGIDRRRTYELKTSLADAGLIVMLPGGYVMRAGQ